MLSPSEYRRYARHLTLPEIGAPGQQKLKSASVLIVGAGGLASSASQYLAAAGVGRIQLIDDDLVDLSNLQRQILYSTEDVSQSKVEVAQRKLRAINPHLEIVGIRERFTSSNAIDLVHGVDVVVDTTDNIPTRYLINQVCCLEGIPWVYGSIYRFEGQLSVFCMPDGPCYRCLFPEPPPPDLVPSCAEGGVLGVLPGILGAMQAAEVIKIICAPEKTSSGSVILYNALSTDMQNLKIDRQNNCPSCGPSASILPLRDFEESCRGQTHLPHVSVEEVQSQRLNVDYQFLDVRTAIEREIDSIGGTHIPLAELRERQAELSEGREIKIVVYCESGVRSLVATGILLSAGYENVENLTGGLKRWRQLHPIGSEH